MNLSSQYWSPFHVNDCAFYRNVNLARNTRRRQIINLCLSWLAQITYFASATRWNTKRNNIKASGRRSARLMLESKRKGLSSERQRLGDFKPAWQRILNVNIFNFYGSPATVTLNILFTNTWIGGQSSWSRSRGMGTKIGNVRHNIWKRRFKWIPVNRVTDRLANRD